VREADEAEFREFAAARLARLRRVGYLICGDWHLAEDAVSTVLVKVYQDWVRLKRVDNLDGYVRTMLVRAIVDERRRPWRRETPAQEPGEAGAGEPGAGWSWGEAVHDRVVLGRALRAVPPRRRAVIVLRFFEGLSVAETAEAMGCSVGTVKSQTAHALETLRRLLPGDYLLTGGEAAR
jgi:RNA polymerase sigma-70 factor (sigma-E family)